MADCFLHRRNNVLTIHMSHRRVFACWQQNRSTITQAKEITFNAMIVIALAVHHRQTQAGVWKPLRLPRFAKRIFRGALIHAIEPIIEIIAMLLRGLRYYSSGIVLLV